jgi:N-acetylmuramoyl-L-alanine amidase
MIVFCFSPKNGSIYASSDVIYTTIIILDAGHGGEDVGAVGFGGIYEKDLNLEITEKIGEYLSNSGFGVVFTRMDDKLLYTEEENVKGYRKIYDLKNRAKISNSYSDAIFISIHMNWFSDPSCHGAEIYHADDTDSSMLASCVRDSIINKVQPDNKRKIKNGSGIYLLEHSDNPAILIECGFL